MVPFLILTLSLVINIPRLSESSIEANSLQPLQKRVCWLCNVPRCKECVVSQWTPWNQCSAPCGNKGYQSRTRLVHRPPSCANGSCQHLNIKEWQPCNRFCYNAGSPSRWFCSCPINYIGDCCETAFSGWSNWGDWGKCNRSCGSGIQVRMRVCIGSSQANSSVCGSACSGPSVETRECNTHNCTVEYESLGCFKDGLPRALPLFIENFRGDIDWANMTKTVHACAELVQNRGLTIFGIQFYGECWSGLDSGKTYDMYGPSKDCWNGVGKKGTNFVYKIKV